MRKNKIVIPGVYHGIRGGKFKEFIYSVLKLGELKQKYMDILLDEKNIVEYSKAFTSETVDIDNNYEIYEQKGDTSINKFIVDYSYRRFPQLNCTKGVKVVARLKINYGSKNKFADFAGKLNFWEYISASEEVRRNPDKLLEDCFEAFFGCTEHLIDTMSVPGVGFNIIYDILKIIYDREEISLKYEDLYDPTTRVKELVDYINKRNSLQTSETKYDIKHENRIISSDPPRNRCDTFLIDPINNKKILIGSDVDAIQSVARNKSSLIAIEHLKSQGYDKPIPEEYQYFENYKNLRV